VEKPNCGDPNLTGFNGSIDVRIICMDRRKIGAFKPVRFISLLHSCHALWTYTPNQPGIWKTGMYYNMNSNQFLFIAITA
jgi:hypothetical protein